VRLIPKIYDTERVVRVMHEDGEEEAIGVNQVVFEQGEQRVLNDLTIGDYDVVVDSGPSYATKRQEAADSMLQFAAAVPQAAAATMDLIASNMDWPGADQIADRLKKILPPGLADSQEGQPLAPPPPPPVNPKDATAAAANAAKADLTKAQTVGQQLDNLAKEFELEHFVQNLSAAMAQAQQLTAALTAMNAQTGAAQGGMPGAPGAGLAPTCQPP